MTEPVTEFQLEAPAGLIGIKAQCKDGKDGKVTQVTFKNGSNCRFRILTTQASALRLASCRAQPKTRTPTGKTS